MKRPLIPLSAFFLLAAASVFAAGDAARGASEFQVCRGCHSTIPGEHLTGPSHANVWQHNAGSVAGYRRYSEALARSNVVWNDKTLDQWLADPAAFIPGTSMTFPGLRDAAARQDVIAYLKSVSEGKAPAAPPGAGGGMMMGMRGSTPDLKKAPPEGQVTALTYCGDTYTVKTADGKVSKVWDFNLRLKTDSSQLGPYPGKPVIVGAGMQGDRASVVFAAPGEISHFITTSCP